MITATVMVIRWVGDEPLNLWLMFSLLTAIVLGWGLRSLQDWLDVWLDYELVR